MSSSKKSSKKLTLNNIYITFLQMFFAFYIIFGYTVQNYYMLSGLFFCFAALFFLLKKRQYISLNKMIVLLLFLLFLQLASSIWAPNQTLAIKNTIAMIINVLIIIILGSSNVLNNKVVKYLFGFSSIHVIGTILQFFTPALVSNFSIRILNNSQYLTNQQLLRYSKAYAGITGQTGNNAFYISVFLLSLISIISKKEKWWWNILLIPGFVALFLTQKRSYIIFLAIYWVVDYFIISKRNRKISLNSLKKVIAVPILIFIFHRISLSLFDFTKLIEKFQRGSVDNLASYSDARVSLWQKALELIPNRIFRGYGYLASDSLLGMYVHNNYLQVFLEMGLFAFASYLLIILISFLNCVKGRFMNFEFSILCLLIWLSFMSTWYFEIDQSILFFYVVIKISNYKKEIEVRV